MKMDNAFPTRSPLKRPLVIYDEQGVLYAAHDAEDRVIRVHYDEVGRMAAFEDANGGRTQRVYDANDNLIRVTDPLGRSTLFVYDALDRLIQETSPSGATRTFGYHAMGNATCVTDACGQRTEYEYDKEERLIARLEPNGAKTRYEWDEWGRLIGIIDPLGQKQRFVYDAGDRLMEVWDAQGKKVQELTYDKAGNIRTEIDGLGHTTQYGFNKLNQCVQTVNAAGYRTTFAYDAAARLTEVLENEAALYKQHYDGEDRLTSYTDANGNETTLRYDKSGLLLEERNATGEGILYRYDKRGWLSERTNARGQETSYRYDAAGQLVEQRDEAGTIHREYDEEGRVVRVQEEGRGEKLRVYDEEGRIIACTDSLGHTLQYAYDEAGHLRTLVYPDGKRVHYTYDAAGHLTEVTDWAGRVTQYAYDANGQLIRTKRPNGTVEQRSYDAAGQLVRLWDQNRQGVLLQQYRFRYNEIGQIIQEEEKQYTYDALRRLVSGEYPGRRVWYTYDQGGNVTTIGETDATSTNVMTYARDNRLETVDGNPVVYDEDGNLLSMMKGMRPEAYTYDARNRLVRTGKASYTYDAEHVRTSMTWDGKTTRYVVDQIEELSRVLMEVDETGTPKAYYVYGLGLIGREDANGQYHAYHMDMRGSTTVLSDWAGRVTDRYTYGVYGELEKHEGTTRQPFCYNGRDGVMTDPNGLYYMRARYYHPGLKRFLNRDVLRGEITDGQTFNRFAYVNGDPVQFIDPLGLMKDCKTKTLKEWLKDSPDLLEETKRWHKEKPEWWGIDPDKTPVFYRTKAEVDEIRKLPGESGGHHPHGLALGGPKGQKLTHTGETRTVKNPTHSKVTGLQRKVINKIKKQQ